MIRKKLFRKTRKYPIQRDIYGKSLRQRAFAYFGEGKRPAEVSRILDMKPNMATRYFQDWKRDNVRNIKGKYELAKLVLSPDSGIADDFINTLAQKYGMPREQVIERLREPWGLYRFVSGKWPNYNAEKVLLRKKQQIKAARDLIRFLEVCGMDLEEIQTEISNLIDKALKKRVDKDARRD